MNSTAKRAWCRQTVLWCLTLLCAEAAASPGADDLVQRVIPKQARYFVTETIAKDDGRDVFEVDNRKGTILLRGNDNVSIASALNWYLQRECHCDISWNCGDQLKLSRPLPAVPQKARVVSPHHFRYAYNFCTHGYTMAWWDWPQWQRELDYLALNGVNLALIIEGQESVWIETLKQFGYSAEEVRAWLVMPSHQPWMYMDNMEGYGGPIPEELVERRLDLGRKVLTRMRALGMEPVLPGYYGMVPPDFKQRFPEAKILSQGNWCNLKRPDIIDPTDPMFARVASAFYRAQTKLFGPAKFFSADPFHEGGNTGSIDIPAAGRAILKAMDGGTWVMQSWQANPRQEMIDALDKDKLLVLDLFCEDRENWRQRNNFNGTPWLWCTIHNFGGNVDMGGRLAWMGIGPVKAMNDPARGRLSGLGVLMEGSQVNPVLWEYVFQNAWRDSTPDLTNWLADYALRRYGRDLPATRTAWKILADTIYNAPAAQGEYPVNSLVCARPSLDPNQRAREWAGIEPAYDTARLVEAWELLLAAAPEVGRSEGYRFDLCDVGRQVLANEALSYHRQIIAAYEAKDTHSLKLLGGRMAELIRDLDRLVGTRREFLLGTWLADARAWGGTVQEKDQCERNARELLTVWTEHDNLTDYSNRQWNGLLGKFYCHRWEMWLAALNDSLARGVALDGSAERLKIRDWELSWTCLHDKYPIKPQGDVVAISRELAAKYAPPLATAGNARAAK